MASFVPFDIPTLPSPMILGLAQKPDGTTPNVTGSSGAMQTDLTTVSQAAIPAEDLGAGTSSNTVKRKPYQPPLAYGYAPSLAHPPIATLSNINCTYVASGDIVHGAGSTVTIWTPGVKKTWSFSYTAPYTQRVSGMFTTGFYSVHPNSATSWPFDAYSSVGVGWILLGTYRINSDVKKNGASILPAKIVGRAPRNTGSSGPGALGQFGGGTPAIVAATPAAEQPGTGRGQMTSQVAPTTLLPGDVLTFEYEFEVVTSLQFYYGGGAGAGTAWLRFLFSHDWAYPSTPENNWARYSGPNLSVDFSG